MVVGFFTVGFFTARIIIILFMVAHFLVMIVFMAAIFFGWFEYYRCKINSFRMDCGIEGIVIINTILVVEW